MKKEVFLAISIGFILGLVITFGIWTANKSLKNLPAGIPASPTPSSSTPDAGEVTPAPQPAANLLPLTISSPIDEALLDKNTVSVVGKTQAGATIALISETGEQILTADSSGNFSADITLEGGYNLISITAYDKDGHSTSQTLTVTYTTAKI